MTTRTLAIVIDSGQQTCASAPGKFCPQLRTSHYGSKYSCQLFGQEILDEQGGVQGWLQRCPECLVGEAQASQLLHYHQSPELLSTPTQQDLEDHRARILKRHGRTK